MVLDLGVAAPLARLALRLAALVARLADEGVAVGAAAEPRHAPPPGAGPVPAGNGKMHTAGKDFALSVSLALAAGPSPYDTHTPPPAPPAGSASATATATTVVPGFGTLAVSTIGPAFAHTTATATTTTGPHHGPGAVTAFAALSAALGPWAAPTAEEEVVRRRSVSTSPNPTPFFSSCRPVASLLLRSMIALTRSHVACPALPIPCPFASSSLLWGVLSGTSCCAPSRRTSWPRCTA